MSPWGCYGDVRLGDRPRSTPLTSRVDAAAIAMTTFLPAAQAGIEPSFRVNRPASRSAPHGLIGGESQAARITAWTRRRAPRQSVFGWGRPAPCVEGTPASELPVAPARQAPVPAAGRRKDVWVLYAALGMALLLVLGFSLAVFFRSASNATDSDGDGLPNTLERQRGTSPNNPDTDGDAIPDGVEVNMLR